MILLGLGANLPSPAGPPQATLLAALSELAQHNVRVVARSPFYRTAPVPVSDQPWFVNAVAVLDTALSPSELLGLFQEIERRFGRVRGPEKNAARSLDLDLLDYQGNIVSTPDLLLPHPAIHERAFVLLPLRDVAPEWRHPVFGKPVAKLIARLDEKGGARQVIERVA